MSSKREYFKVLSYVMIAIGEWEFKEETNVYFQFVYKHFLSKIVFYHFLLMTQFFLFTPIVWRDCPSRLIEHVTMYFQFMNTNIITLVLKKSTRIQEIIKYILKYEENKKMTTRMKVIYSKNAKLNDKITIGIGILIVVVGVYWMFSSIR